MQEAKWSTLQQHIFIAITVAFQRLRPCELHWEASPGVVVALKKQPGNQNTTVLGCAQRSTSSGTSWRRASGWLAEVGWRRNARWVGHRQPRATRRSRRVLCVRAHRASQEANIASAQRAPHIRTHTTCMTASAHSRQKIRRKWRNTEREGARGVHARGYSQPTTAAETACTRRPEATKEDTVTHHSGVATERKQPCTNAHVNRLALSKTVHTRCFHLWNSHFLSSAETDALYVCSHLHDSRTSAFTKPRIGGRKQSKTKMRKGMPTSESKSTHWRNYRVLYKRPWSGVLSSLAQTMLPLASGYFVLPFSCQIW